MKKMIVVLLAIVVLVGCSNPQDLNNSSIKVYTRDSESGTREAFESIIGLDELTLESAETTSNGDMAKQVGNNLNAIGYVSLTTDLDSNNLKDVKYNGVEASIDTVNSGEYTLARPFSFVTREKGDYDSQTKEDLIIAFLDYLTNSKQGKEMILASGGIVDMKNSRDWEEMKHKHPITLQDNSNVVIRTGGSTSVVKTLNAAIESFIPLAGNFKYEPNHTGSGDGYKRTLGDEKDGPNGIDLGFASREFKDEENVEKALLKGVYSKDAVVVVVHQENSRIENLSTKELVEIFNGTITSFEGLNSN